jgi:hypothetical protein
LKHAVRRSSLQVAKRGSELMARNSIGPTMIGDRPSRDDVAPWENQQLEQLESESISPTAAANAADDNTAVVPVVRHKRASRILSGSFFSRGS